MAGTAPRQAWRKSPPAPHATFTFATAPRPAEQGRDPHHSHHPTALVSSLELNLSEAAARPDEQSPSQETQMHNHSHDQVSVFSTSTPRLTFRV